MLLGFLICNSSFLILGGTTQGNQMAFEKGMLNIPKARKVKLVGNLWSWVKIVYGDHPGTSLNFVDWLAQ